MKNKIQWCLQTTSIIITIAIILTVNILCGQDNGYIIKGMAYSQTSASGPVSLGYFFNAQLTCLGASTVTNAVLTPPGKPAIPMTNKVDEFQIRNQYLSQLGMDSEFPNGNYILRTEGANYTASVSISLTGNSYPTSPQISNFAAAQNIDPNQDFTLTWNSLGLTTNDFIQLSISGVNVTDTVFETPPPFKPGALRGNATSFTIPANTLYPALKYKCELVAAKIVNIITNNNADGTKTVLISGYVKILEFPLGTSGTATNVFAWRKPNFVFFFPDGSIIETNAQFTTPRTIANYNLFFQALDQSPTNTVFFTGPAGSGLNNTSNAYYNPPYTGQGWAGYGSPVINITSPNQITGGVYTITYKGVSLKFSYNDPQLANKQIFLVPEFVVGSDGILSRIKWSYVRSDGEAVSPRDFMQRVGIIVNAAWGDELFKNFDLRPGFTNYVITNTTVYWNDVGSVQIGFTDDEENNFMTTWKAPAGPRPMVITTGNISGKVGEEFSEILNVIGGMYPYTWSIEYGFLPSGLFLSDMIGLIDGIPGEAGNFKVKFKVQDALGETASKDIIIQIEQGALNHQPAFTNMTFIKGLPTVTILTMENQFYHLEMSQDLKKWTKANFFTAPSDKMSVSVPPEIFNSYNKLFFRVGLGHKFYSDMFLIFYANAGVINSVSPYNVTINYPVSINYTHAVFEADFDSDYATADQVYFGNPINASVAQMMGGMEAEDPGTIGYWSKLCDGVLPPGIFAVVYKGMNMNFNINHQATSHLVIPEPSFVVNNGLLTQISWAFKSCTDGLQIPPPSFLNNGSLGLFDNKTNELHRYCITNKNETNYLFPEPIAWNSIKRVQMQYESDSQTLFVITFDKN